MLGSPVQSGKARMGTRVRTGVTQVARPSMWLAATVRDIDSTLGEKGLPDFEQRADVS